MVPSLTSYDLPFPQNWVPYAPQHTLSEHLCYEVTQDLVLRRINTSLCDFGSFPLLIYHSYLFLAVEIVLLLFVKVVYYVKLRV